MGITKKKATNTRVIFIFNLNQILAAASGQVQHCQCGIRSVFSSGEEPGLVQHSLKSSIWLSSQPVETHCSLQLHPLSCQSPSEGPEGISPNLQLSLQKHFHGFSVCQPYPYDFSTLSYSNAPNLGVGNPAELLADTFNETDADHHRIDNLACFNQLTTYYIKCKVSSLGAESLPK